MVFSSLAASCCCCAENPLIPAVQISGTTSDLQAQVGRAITSYEGRRKRAAVTDLEERARALGFSLGELVGIETVRRRRPALAKYANPSNASETWSGRGRRPRWLELAMKMGKSLDDLRI